MPANLRFWRNLTLIGLVHVALIVGLVRWSSEAKNANPQSVVWMSAGGGDGIATENKQAPPPPKAQPRVESKTEPPEIEERDDDRPVLTAAKSEIQLSATKPSPTSTPTATPIWTPTPKPKATPTPTPKPKPKPKSSTKKINLAKASPKPTPRAKPTPEDASDKKEQQSEAEAEKKKIAKAALAKTETTENPKQSAAVQTGSGKGTSPGGGGGHAGGTGIQSQFGWYGSMLHDRFYSEWVQPTGIASAGARNSVLVKMRIERDGHISNFEIVKPSGNAEVDESVAAVAKRVTQVDPLPAGLGKGDHYDVKINFELNSDQ
jgi:colicin import membrane protein